MTPRISLFAQKGWKRIRQHFALNSEPVTQAKTRPHIVAVHWAGDCVMQWFIILGSIDFIYTFYWLECIATPDPWNRIEIAS